LPSQNEEVKILMELGLTLDQARIYLALVQSGWSSAETIYEFSKVTRENVYRIMPKLQKLGLVEKAITIPAKFKAIPIKEGLSILRERQIKKTSELQAKITKLLNTFGTRRLKTASQKEEPQFVLIPKEEAFLLRLKNASQNAKTNVDMITAWDEFRRWFYAAEGFEEDLERGLKFRIIMEKPQDKKPLREVMKECKKSPFWKVRYLLSSPTVFMMFDNKEVIICNLATSRPPTVTPALWSNNPSLLAIISGYFEIMWLTSLEDENEEH
jgi:sugar-specific transcriptional regulator TrmB